ncbi:MAG: hypothetical protein HC836_22750 [Richelia sp. RM2_1_2]|nr:hypothetical protein [Richelia sp. RM2_1_2]
MIPLFAPILGFGYDAVTIREELLRDCWHLLTPSGAIKERLKYYNPSFSVCTDEELEENSYQIFDDKQNRTWVAGKYNAWFTANLTYIPDNADTTWQNVTAKDGKIEILREKYKEPWQWRPELLDKNKLPYLKNYLTRFPFEYLQCVRLIVMEPPAIGMIHQDSNRGNMYYQNGFAGFNLNVFDGGGILRFQNYNTNKVYDVDNSCKIFHFDDSTLHGVTKTSTQRIQFRIYGKLCKNYNYLNMLDLEKAIW